MENSIALPSIESIEARLAGLKMSLFDDVHPCFSPMAGAAYLGGTPYTDHRAYSSPPSPIRMTSISRFHSPIFAGDRGTPSLLDGSLSSTLSSPSLVHTPMRYTTTRGVPPDTVGKGLGFSGLLLQDGSVFDGMGALPKRDESSELGFFMDEADVSGNWCDSEPRGYPEQEEDAWRTGISGSFDTSACASDVFQTGRVPHSPSPTGRSQGKWQSMLPRMSTPILPPEPLADDVFFSHMPYSSTPRSEAPRKEHRNAARAAVSSWRGDVQEAALET